MKRPLFTLPVPDAVHQALKKSGFRYYEDLWNDDGGLRENVDALLQKVNFSPQELKQTVIAPLVDTAGQLLQNEALLVHIPTFSQSLDRILGGGVISGSVLQVCGGPGSAKTQFLLQLCVNVQLPECFGGLEGASLFIDTDSGFSPHRLKEIAEGAVEHCTRIASNHQMTQEIRNFTVDSIMNNVHYTSVETCIELIAAIERAYYFISSNSKVKIISIDCLNFPFLRMNNSFERTRIVYMIIDKLSKIAEDFNVAVVFTNHLTTKVEQNSKYLVPSLGESVAHRIPHTLLLAKMKGNFTAVMSKSSTSPETVAPFDVTSEGLRDIQ